MGKRAFLEAIRSWSKGRRKLLFQKPLLVV